MAVHDETGGAGFFDKPGMNKFLAQVGLGMLLAGMPQRRKGMRGQVMAPWLAGGVKSLYSNKDEQLKRRLLEARIGEYAGKRKTRKRSDEAREKLARFYANYNAPVGPERRVPGPAGAAPVTAQALPPPRPMSEMSRNPQYLGLLSEAYGAKALPYLMRSRKAPTTRRRIQGSATIQEQFDPATGEFSEIGRGPRFKPGGGTTLAQRSNNAKIDAARRELTAAGLSREEILKRSKKATDTGRDNPNYDPFIGRLVATATQRKVGDDPDFDSVYQRIHRAGGPAAPSVGQAQGTAGSPQEAPSLLSPKPVAALPVPRYPGMPRSTPGPAQQSATVGQTVTIEGKSFEVIGSNLDGTVVVMDLGTGQQFIAEYER